MSEAAFLIGGPKHGTMVRLENPVDYYEVYELPKITPALKRHEIVPHTVTVKRYIYERSEKTESGFRAYRYLEPT